MAKRIFILIDRLALLATQQGGFVSKQELVKTLTLASQQAFNALVPAKAARPLGPGLNRALDARLAPFVRRQDYNSQPTGNQLPIQTGGLSGQFTLPADCAYVDYYDLPGAVTVETVSGAALRYKRADPIEGPSAAYPLVTTVENGDVQMYPAETDHCTVQYYAYPDEPVYFEDYTNGRPVYDDTQSADMGWTLAMEPELLVRSLRLLGLEIRDPQLQAVAAQLTAESQ